MPDQSNDIETLIGDLRQLANRWTMRARDHARESKTRNASSDIATANYHRGIAETYYKMALELADLVAQSESAGTASAAPPAAEQEAAPETTYAAVSLNEAVQILDYAGVNARDINLHKDNVFSAVFSRWQPVSESERVDMLKRADMRIVILKTGKLRDTSDPFIEFAFKDTP
jgi:hypothetical protein